MGSEKKERAYLDKLLLKIDVRLSQIDEAIQLKKDEIDYMNSHMEDHKRDMDHLEKNAMRETIHNYSLQGSHALENRKRLLRLKDTAYFGRVDFVKKNSETAQNIYVGVHNFQDPDSNANLVFDWRAPISGLFYDFEPGPGWYETQSGTEKGDVLLKRQFRIRKGVMEYMLDTDVTIHDEVLQKELNQASSAKMKNIVATIQKEQNAIIRNELAHHLIIQGVAGSGKTSIALHRIAFLLYRFKETLVSEDILIISPNKVFSSYISNVLPELGEETVEETSMEDIAHALFEHQVKFETFFEQVARLLDKNDPILIERIRFKSSPELPGKMDEYITYLENEGFQIADIFVRGKPVPGWFIEETFRKFARMPLLKRFNAVVQEIVDNVYRFYQIEIQYKDRTELHNTIRKMFPSYNPRVLYKGFYQWLGRPDLLRINKGSIYEWGDVYALLYLKVKLEGLSPNNRVKHLVVDEMQDYSAVQYKVLGMMFPCKKTILGDVNQAVNPFSSSSVEGIEEVFSGATTMTMRKSYRSTFEITEFTRRIRPGALVEPIERHGPHPQVVACQSFADEFEQLGWLVDAFKKSQFNSLGIVCKTQRQADDVFEMLKDVQDIDILNAGSVAFGSGIVITTAHLAKGLEFDQVVVPFCSEKNFNSELDRQMLYVACTRAMHHLTLTHTGKPSPFSVNP